MATFPLKISQKARSTRDLAKQVVECCGEDGKVLGAVGIVENAVKYKSQNKGEQHENQKSGRG
jgi:hypothetical protein